MSAMSTTSAVPTPPLTSLSHGGGCGCKLSPGVLADLLKGSTVTPFAVSYTHLTLPTNREV